MILKAAAGKVSEKISEHLSFLTLLKVMCRLCVAHLEQNLKLCLQQVQVVGVCGELCVQT